MKDLTKYYIDLSKCTEKQRKCIVKILNATVKYILWSIDDAVDFLIHYNNRWCTTDDKEDLINKTELTYPEFIKLFEGGEGNNGWIKIESKSQYDLLENGEYHWYNINTGRYDKGDLWEFGTFTHYQPIIKPEPPKF